MDKEHCQHTRVRLSIIEENATGHRIVDGEIVESYENYEAEPTDEIDCWCEDCHAGFHYDHYQDAPAWLKHLYDLAYKHDYQEDHGYSGVDHYAESYE